MKNEVNSLRLKRQRPLALQGDSRLDALRSQGTILDTGRTKTKDVYEGALSYDEVEDQPPAPVLDDPVLDQVFKTDATGRGQYLIEIRFGKHRSRDYAVARIDLFENSRLTIATDRKNNKDTTQSFTVGTTKMFMCGYDDCGHPIPESHVGAYITREQVSKVPREMWEQKMRSHWAICPTCQDKKQNNMGRQVSSAEFSGFKVKKNPHDKQESAKVEAKLIKASNSPYITDPVTKARYAVLRDCLMIAAPMRAIAEQVARLWDMFEGDADVYMKYHPLSMREQISLGYYDQQQSTYDERDELAIYPMVNILKDTASGAALTSRFEAFFLS